MAVLEPSRDGQHVDKHRKRSHSHHHKPDEFARPRLLPLPDRQSKLLHHLGHRHRQYPSNPRVPRLEPDSPTASQPMKEAQRTATESSGLLPERSRFWERKRPKEEVASPHFPSLRRPVKVPEKDSRKDVKPSLSPSASAPAPRATSSLPPNLNSPHTHLPTQAPSASPPSEPRPLLPQGVTTPRCEIFLSGQTGKGVRATKRLTAGSIIISEIPFIRFSHPITPESIGKAVRNLPKDKAILFSTFKDTVPGVEDKNVRIAETNAIPLARSGAVAEDQDPQILGEKDDGDDDGDDDVEAVEECNISGMFETICRVNHSCEPNATWIWDKSRQRLELRAIRDIPPSGEITASYLDDLMKSRFERQIELLESFGFRCVCSACSKSVGGISVSDKNIARFGELRQKIDLILHDPKPRTPRERSMDMQAARKIIKEALKIANIEKKVEAKGDLYMQLFSLLAGNGDRSGAEHAAVRAFEHYTKTIGREAVRRTKLDTWITRPDQSPHWKQWERMGGQIREPVLPQSIESKHQCPRDNAENEEKEAIAYLARYQEQESDDDYEYIEEY